MIFIVNTNYININYNNYCENINEKYIEIIKNDKKNKMLIDSFDTNINDENITSFIIFRKIILNNEIKFIILLMGVNKEIRNYGYGKYILDEFINKIILSKSKKDINLYIHEVESSMNFFINYGFEKIEYCQFLKNYEGWNKENNNNKLLFKYNVKNKMINKNLLFHIYTL
jgi:predicted GNAT family N-acyltransferase